MCKICDEKNYKICKYSLEKYGILKKVLDLTKYNFNKIEELEPDDSVFWGELAIIKTTTDTYLEFGGDSVGEIKIKYCPFCGKKFEPLKNKNKGEI
jgi:hypothetical protein